MKSAKKTALIFVLAAVLSLAVSLVSAAEARSETPEPSGAYLKFTVDVNKPEDVSLAYNFIAFKRINYVLQEGDRLEYDVWFNTEEPGWGHVDGTIVGRGNLRDTHTGQVPIEIADDSGSPHPQSDLSGYAYDKWHRRALVFGDELAGAEFREIQVSMHPDVPELEYQGIAYYDNIVITNGGEVKLVIFQDESDVDPAAFTQRERKDSTAKLEVLNFTAEDMAGFEAAEQARAAAEEERRRQREEAEASRERARAEEEASRERASIDASIKQSEEDAAAAEEAGGGEDKNGGPSLIPIAAAAAAAIIVIIIIAVIAAGKKKNKTKPKV